MFGPSERNRIAANIGGIGISWLFGRFGLVLPKVETVKSALRSSWNYLYRFDAPQVKVRGPGSSTFEWSVPGRL